jgi:hypothetical protein
LREVLAAAGHDFVLTGPASKLKSLRDKLLAAKRRGLGRRIWRGRRYLTLLLAFFFAATAAGILLNALLWQKTRHPAPLFSRAIHGVAAKKLTAAETIALPGLRRPETPSKPAQALETQKSVVDKAPAPVAVGGSPRKPAAGDASPTRPHDQISHLLQTTPAAPATRPIAATGRPAIQSKSVLAAQRALIKLGFVLKPDGVAGAATRQAIQRYERDRGLPVHGDLTPALVQKLSAETGISID